MPSLTLRATLPAEPTIERFLAVTEDGVEVEVRLPAPGFADQAEARIRDAAVWLAQFRPSLAPQVVGLLYGPGGPGLVTACPPGASLRQVGALRLPLGAVAELVRQIADQLAQLERLRDPADQRLVRAAVRGLGPDTLYLSPAGELRLTGWELLGGSWRGREAQTREAKPVEAQRVDPEQRRGNAEATTGSFDLALLFLRLLVGRSEVEALEDDLIECSDEVAHSERLTPFLAQHLRGADPDLVQLLTRALSWRQADRPVPGALASGLARTSPDRQALADFAVQHSDALTVQRGRFHTRLGEPLEFVPPPEPTAPQQRRPKGPAPVDVVAGPEEGAKRQAPRGPARPTAPTSKRLDWANTTEWSKVKKKPPPRAGRSSIDTPAEAASALPLLEPGPAAPSGVPPVKELTTMRRVAQTPKLALALAALLVLGIAGMLVVLGAALLLG